MSHADAIRYNQCKMKLPRRIISLFSLITYKYILLFVIYHICIHVFVFVPMEGDYHFLQHLSKYQNYPLETHDWVAFKSTKQ